MIPTSALLREAIRYSHTLEAEVDILRGGVVIENDVPLVAGSVITDRGSNARYSADVEMALYPWETLPIDAYGTRIRVRTGYSSIGRKETVQLGEYRVDDYGRTDDGTVAIALKGLENYAIDARFERPRTPPYRASTVGTITDLITEVVPHAEVEALCTYDRRVTARAPWEKERWDDAVVPLGESIYTEVYADHRGVFVIADSPSLVDTAPVFLIDAGDTGVLVKQQTKSSRDRVYNAVSVSTSSTADGDTPALWYVARDDDPASPTYFYGEFGQVTKFYSSQYFTTQAQLQTTGERMLAEALAANKTLTVEALPLPFVVAGDVAAIKLMDGSLDKYLLQKTTTDLKTGAWSADTLATKSSEEAA